MTESPASQPEPIAEAAAERETAPPAGSRRGVRWPRGTGLAWLLLLVLLTAAVLASPADRSPGVVLANPDGAAMTGLQGVLDDLPGDSIVLVALDADLGTYPEIRPAVRAACEDLLRRGSALAFVSVTAEGRAIAAAEIDRLHAGGAGDDVVLDLGYIAGVEAGLVRLVGSPLPSNASGPLADAIRERGGGLDAFDLALLVGGSDAGPRSWVEQVATRLPANALPMVAIAPTFAQPELAPYLRSGQLSALIATVRDVAAYADAASIGIEDPSPTPVQRQDRPPSALAMLAGMMVALLVLARQLLGALPAIGRLAPRERPHEEQQ
jgi:hypothetical protein